LGAGVSGQFEHVGGQRSVNGHESFRGMAISILGEAPELDNSMWAPASNAMALRLVVALEMALAELGSTRANAYDLASGYSAFGTSRISILNLGAHRGQWKAYG